MKKLVAFLFAFTIMCALAVGLVGCGPDYRENFEGTWQVVALTDSAGTDRSGTIEQLASADKFITLTLSDDDTAYLDTAGQAEYKGKWKPTGEYACQISFEGYGDIPATLSEDGLLTLDEDGQTMTFQRPADPEPEEQPGGDQAEQPEEGATE